MERKIVKAKAGGTALHLMCCGLSHIPPQVFELTHLWIVWLYDNTLASIPEDISRLTSLTHLYLSNNLIINIPHSISALTSVIELDLSNNQITSLPHTLSTLTALQYLYLDRNQLIHIPRGISSLTTLKHLTLNKNPSLKYLPYSVVEEGHFNCVDTVIEYLSTHPSMYERSGRRQLLWKQIKLMYIGNKESGSCFSVIPPEVIVKIEYLVLCDPYVA